MKMLQNIKVLYSIIIGLLIIVLGLGLYSILGQGQNGEGNKQEEVVDFNVLPKINHAQFKEKFDSGEEFYVYIGRPDCGDSRLFEKQFLDLFVHFDENDKNIFKVDYDLDKKIYYFDISEIIDSTGNTAKRKEYFYKYGFYGTPTLARYKDGQIVSMAEWNPLYGFPISEYMAWFYDNDLIDPRVEIIHPGVSNRVKD